MSDIANKLNFTSTEDWYKLSFKDVIDHGGRGLLKKYKDSHISLLLAVFPELHLQIHKFSTVPRHYWDDADNRKKFLEVVAKKHNITSQDGWYSLSKQVSHFAYRSDNQRISSNVAAQVF